jgi:hypothetical protein
METFGLKDDMRSHSHTDRLLDAVKAEERVWDMCKEVVDEASGGLRSWLLHACEYVAHEERKVIWGDKSPYTLLDIPLVTHLLPNARFIHVIRDGRAVAVSHRDRQYSYLKLGINTWKYMLVKGRIYGNILGSRRYTEVIFEELVSSPQREMQEVCRFLGVDYEEQMLDLGRSEATSGTKAYVKPEFDKEKIAGWRAKLSSNEIRELEQIAGDLLQALGYDLLVHSAEGPFESLTPLRVALLRQRKYLRDMLRSRQISMVDQELVQTSTSFQERLRRFARKSARLYFSEKIIEHFRGDRTMVGPRE